MLDVIARSQRGRVCEYKRSESTVVTPFVMTTTRGTSDDPVFISVDGRGRTLHVMGTEVFIDADLLTSESSDISVDPKFEKGVSVLRLPITGDDKIVGDTEIVVIANAFELRKDARRLVSTIIRLRESVGYNVLICAPGLADPSNMALLTYMGVDIFDDSVSFVSGKRGINTIPEGGIVTGDDVSSQNVEEMHRECEKIRDFIRGGRLRELVDQRAASSSFSVAVLRIFDRVGYEYQEEACSTVGCRFACNTTQSLRRPEILRYRERMMEEYRRPEHKRILLLLPCSAKKPYHTSKTHKRFASAIHTADHDTIVHEVIVTSPLGLVPRELDVFFPASSYDIPVTGEWKCQEKEMIREMLAHFIEMGYEKVISHLGEDTELIAGLTDVTETCVGDVTSPASLTKLDETLREVTKGMKFGDYMVDRKETVRSLLGYQFGNRIADAIMDEDTFATGKFPYWKIMRGKTQLGMLTAERGMVSLTMEGAEILYECGTYTVEMGDFDLAGNLFAVGVVDADPSIRIGDEVAVVCDGKVKGVGVAAMSGREMKELRRGIAVKIRHKAR
ncbi:MAG: DUF5591 domain-containing protein [Candidatus Methanomethylophilaceae archaeon]